MQFKIGDFIVTTSKIEEQLQDKVAVPTNLNSGKPSEYIWKHKTREITVFKGLSLLEKDDETYYSVVSELFDFIDLVELLKAFTSNKLDTSKEYQISDKFMAETAQKDGNMSLKIQFKNYSYALYLDKFECSSLAAKFSKILQRCEPWQESEV